jgi:hypothetical protein
MKTESHNEIYRVAHDAAASELTEITEEFERLRLRKDQVERLISALRPVIGEDQQQTSAPEAAGTQPAPQLVETKPESVPETKEQTGAMIADPFQRRVDHVLGIGAGIRDVRQYTRQF